MLPATRRALFDAALQDRTLAFKMTRVRLVPLLQEQQALALGMAVVGVVALVPSLIVADVDWLYTAAFVAASAVFWAGAMYLFDRLFARRREGARLEGARRAPSGAEAGTWVDSLRPKLPFLLAFATALVAFQVATGPAPTPVGIAFGAGALALLQTRRVKALERERGARLVVEPSLLVWARTLYTEAR